jgi:hypothetical protein
MLHTATIRALAVSVTLVAALFLLGGCSGDADEIPELTIANISMTKKVNGESER